MTDKLSKLFGLTEQRVDLPEVPEKDQHLDADFEEAKKNLKTLIQTGNTALEEALNLAIDSESPRAYEVLSTLIANLGDMNMKIMDMYIKKQDVIQKKIKNHPGSTTQQPSLPNVNGDVNNTNIVFTGTTVELSDFLKQLNKPKEIIDGEIIENEKTKPD